MKNLIYLLSLPLWVLCLLGCGEEDHSFGEISAPENLTLSVNVIGADADNPNGDGSGLVRFEASADKAISYRFTFSDGTTDLAPSGILEKRFTSVGLNTYDVTVVANGTAGLATTLTDQVTVISTFSDEEAIQLLTGGSSKTWYWAADEPGHLGVGQNDGNEAANFFANFYQAVPFEKDSEDGSRCFYQDELTFSLDNGRLFYSLDNKGATFFNVAYEGVANGSAGFDNCYAFEVSTDPQLVTLSPSESVVVANDVPGQTRGTQLNFTEGGFMSYYIGSSTYEILSITDSRLVVRSVPGNDPGLAWYHVFSSTKPTQGGGGDEEPEYNTLVFSDEFDGDELNTTTWNYETGDGCPNLCGWGNNESQTYTDREENVRVADGLLTIEARREAFAGSDFTSARITTQDKYAFTYGRIEIRARLPRGGGTWPALWMLGSDIRTNPWPGCGEIDIMEHVGNQQNRIFSTLHYPENSGADGVSQSIIDEDVSDEFHVYRAIWSPNTIRFFVDDELYHTFDNDPSIPFNSDFFLIFNVAMGGNFGGDIAPDFQSSSMEVDYVRVYQ